MEVRIEISKRKKLIGKHLFMSFTNNRTEELWKKFMQDRKQIKNNIDILLYSMQIYTPMFFNNFNPNAVFEKWAAVEVTNFEATPSNMETFTLAEGLYAVFLYKGAANAGSKAFEYIFKNWLPNSAYDLDNRPHFEILGEKYKNNEPDSEEEIWIPIKSKF